MEPRVVAQGAGSEPAGAFPQVLEEEVRRGLARWREEGLGHLRLFHGRGRAYPGLEGLYIAGGFSGHGLMQSPAAGKGMSELIRTGGFETLDLSALSVERIFTGRPVVEDTVI